MELFNSRRFAMIIDYLRDFKHKCEEHRKDPTLKPEAEFVAMVKAVFKLAEELAEESHFEASQEKFALSNVHFQFKNFAWDYSYLAAEIRNAEEVLFGDFWTRKFIAIPKEYADDINNDQLFGPEVAAAFKGATPDIREAGNCIAVDMGTAAVFHLMRAVEWGLRALCKHLGILRVPHNKKHIPIEYATWDNMLQKVQEEIDKRVDALGPGKRKQDLQELY
jgi:hypothetical protein